MKTLHNPVIWIVNKLMSMNKLRLLLIFNIGNMNLINPYTVYCIFKNIVACMRAVLLIFHMIIDYRGWYLY